MDTSVKDNETILDLLNNWYVAIRARRIEEAHLLKEEVTNKINSETNDDNTLLYYALLDFRYHYIIDNLGVSQDSFDKVESFKIPSNSFLTYYYHFFKAIHASGIGNHMIAKENFDKAESLLELIPDEMEKAEFYYKLGAFHFDICETLQSVKYTTKAKELFAQHENYERNIGFCENLLGMACTRLCEWALSEEHLITAMDIFQKVNEDKYILMVRHNLGFMYSSQNLSKLAIRYLSEVTSNNPKHYKALYLEAKERYKLNEIDKAAEIADKGYRICYELGNVQYMQHFATLKAFMRNVEAERIESTIIEGLSYFNVEELFDYAAEIAEELAVRFHKEDNAVKASKYFYIAHEARKNAFIKGALK